MRELLKKCSSKIGVTMRLEVTISINSRDEEIKLVSSENSSLKECADELFTTLNGYKPQEDTSFLIERMKKQLQNILQGC